MKTYNYNHDAVIEFNYFCIEKGKQDGELAEHQAKVAFVEKFIPDRLNDKYIKLHLHRDMILQLAKQIEEIEKEIKLIPYDLIPF